MGSNPTLAASVMSQDIRGRLEPLTRLWSGVADTSSLVIHGWVED